jgi:hypothetical protein
MYIVAISALVMAIVVYDPTMLACFVFPGLQLAILGALVWIARYQQPPRD